MEFQNMTSIRLFRMESVDSTPVLLYVPVLSDPKNEKIPEDDIPDPPSEWGEA